MKRILYSLLVVTLPFGSALADAPKSENAKMTLVYQHELPNCPGKSIKGVLVEYGPFMGFDMFEEMPAIPAHLLPSGSNEHCHLCERRTVRSGIEVLLMEGAVRIDSTCFYSLSGISRIRVNIVRNVLAETTVPRKLR